MSPRWASRTAWGLFAIQVAVVGLLIPVGPFPAGPWSAIAGGIFILAFSGTGALVVTRRPSNPVGWLLCLSALAFAVGGVCVEISESAVEAGRDGPVVAAAAWVGTFVWMLGVGPAATFLLLLFPDGRLPSRRWRSVAWLSGASLGVTVVGLALTPGRIEDTLVVNPFGLPGAEDVLVAVVNVGLALLFVCILASCASLVARFRSADRMQRLQLKWVAFSLPLVVLWLGGSVWVESTQTGDTSVEIANTLVSIGLTVVPVAIGIAMLRHRLYDIDVVINRTLVYGSVTATLAAVYLGSVLLLQLALSPLTDTSELAVAASTLAVAALFRPVRSHVQDTVDRRFYRSRYDVGRTLDAFSTRLRHELDLESVSADLRRVVGDTMQPAHVSLWLRSRP